MTTVELSHTDQPVRKKLFGLPIDGLLIVIVGALVSLGLMMVYSTTFDWSYQSFGDPSLIFFQQVRWLGIGLVSMALAAVMPYRWWRRLAVPMMGLTLALLVLVQLIGAVKFNAQRSLFNGSVQPSELATLATIIYLAVWLDSKNDQLHDLSYGVVPFGIIVGVIAGLILLQPDLSAAGMLVMIAIVMFFIGGADILQMGLVGAVGSLAGFIVLQINATGRQRLAEYFAGIKDVTQASWQLQQAAIAFINGGIFGRGLGESHQKFGFLPTPHTDAIFAIIGEELGLIGCVAVILLFVALAWRGFRIATGARDQLGAVLASGIICWVTLAAALNIAVNLGLFPYSGHALPFISYGGSSMVVTLTGMGILLSISRREKSDENIPRRTRANGPAWSWTQRLSDAIKPNATTNLGRRHGRRSISRSVSRDDSDE
jgi:cell division protein FtsW